MTRRRIETLKVLVDGSIVSTHAIHPYVISEFDLVHEARRVPQLPRRYLLQVLHATRALDSYLSAFNNLHGLAPHARALGQYLTALANHTHAALSHLSELDRLRFQRTIANIRNRFMHEAGAFPVREAEVENLLAEMDALLSLVVTL